MNFRRNRQRWIALSAAAAIIFSGPAVSRQTVQAETGSFAGAIEEDMGMMEDQAPVSEEKIDAGTLTGEAGELRAEDLPDAYFPAGYPGNTDEAREKATEDSAKQNSPDFSDEAAGKADPGGHSGETGSEENEDAQQVWAAPSYQKDVRSAAASLPDIRNQGTYGICWAFAPIALIELNMMKRGLADRSVDYSEVALAYSTLNTPQDPLGGLGEDRNYVDSSGGMNFMRIGGSPMWAFQLLAAGYGPVSEASVPYSGAAGVLSNGIASEKVFADQAHLLNMQEISISGNQEIVREKIMQNGAVCVSFYYQNRYYNEDRTAYYCPGKQTANHAAVIVGWDDAYPASSFAADPGTDGAWLVRNSWGTESSGLGGYFWMSYADASLLDTAYAAEADGPDSYQHNYFYDGGFYSTRVSFGKTIEAANIFSAHGGTKGEQLRAVSVGIGSSDTDYTVEIYKDLSDLSDPGSGTLSSRTSGTVSLGGIYTIPLPEKVSLSEGESFSVVVRLSNQDRAKLLLEKSVRAQDRSSSGTAVCEASRETGQSFYKSGGAWVDLTSPSSRISEDSGNFRIKALTVDADVTEALPFADVQPGNYWYDAVRWAWDNGITSGVSESRFGSSEVCTRAQIVTLLYKMTGDGQTSGAGSGSRFADVPADSWYADAVSWAAERGIVAGTGNGRFSPNAVCTRAQAMTMLWHASGSPDQGGTATEFSDVPADSWYAKAVQWASEQKITAGTGPSSFSPGRECTRAEIITFLYRTR